MRAFFSSQKKGKACESVRGKRRETAADRDIETGSILHDTDLLLFILHSNLLQANVNMKKLSLSLDVTVSSNDHPHDDGLSMPFLHQCQLRNIHAFSMYKAFYQLSSFTLLFFTSYPGKNRHWDKHTRPAIYMVILFMCHVFLLDDYK